MVLRTVTNSFLIILTFFITEMGYCQTDKDFYTLFKGGKKYKKIIGYLMLDEKIRVVNKDENTVVYYFNQAMLEHRKKEHTVSICDLKYVESLNLTNLKNLGEIKSKEIDKRLSELDIKFYPRPLNNKMIKIFLLVPLKGEKFRKIEVEWLYTLK